MSLNKLCVDYYNRVGQEVVRGHIKEQKLSELITDDDIKEAVSPFLVDRIEISVGLPTFLERIKAFFIPTGPSVV